MSLPPVPAGLDPKLTDLLLSTPEVELKTVDSFDPADLPQTFFTAVERPMAVTVAQAMVLDTGVPTATTVAWRRGSDEDGVEVTAMADLSSGTSYRLVLRIEGARQQAQSAQTDLGAA